MSPAVSKKQQQLMGADLARARAGKRTRTGMSESQLDEYAGTPRKGLPARANPKTKAETAAEPTHQMPDGHMMPDSEMREQHESESDIGIVRKAKARPHQEAPRGKGYAMIRQALQEQRSK